VGIRDSACTDSFNRLTVLSGGIERERRSASSLVGAVMVNVMRLLVNISKHGSVRTGGMNKHLDGVCVCIAGRKKGWESGLVKMKMEMVGFQARGIQRTGKR
jgi:hypothetical protein